METHCTFFELWPEFSIDGPQFLPPDSPQNFHRGSNGLPSYFMRFYTVILRFDTSGITAFMYTHDQNFGLKGHQFLRDIKFYKKGHL